MAGGGRARQRAPLPGDPTGAGGGFGPRRTSYPDLNAVGSQTHHNRPNARHFSTAAAAAMGRGGVGGGGGGNYLFSKRLRHSTKANSDSLCDALLDFDEEDADLGGFCAPPVNPRDGEHRHRSTRSQGRHSSSSHSRHLSSSSRKVSKRFVTLGINGGAGVSEMASARLSNPTTVGGDTHPQNSAQSRLSDENDSANASAGIHSTAPSTSVTELDSSSMATDEPTARRTDSNENIVASFYNNNSNNSSNNNSSADGFSTRKSPLTAASDTVVVEPPARKRRKWEQHVGGNRFYCNGRIIVSRQCSILLLTVFLITLTMTLFCVFDLPYLTVRVSILLPFAAALLFVLAMSSLFKTSFSDPGILPRAPLRETIEWERQAAQGRQREADSTAEWTPPRTKIVQVAGQNVKLKYCFTCCLFRPPRSSHCSICDNCILNFDHHCPWVGNCVGLRNYRHFYFFIGILSVLDCFIGVCVTTHLVMLSADLGTFMAAMKASPTSMFTAAIALLSVWSIVGLSGFHTYLIAINQTTNEDVKGTFSSKNRPSIRNPYSSANLIRNIIRTLFGPEPPSLLDRRGLVDDDKTITVPEETLKRYAAKYAAFNAWPATQNGGRRESPRRGASDMWATRPTPGGRYSMPPVRASVAPAGRGAAQCAADAAAGCGASGGRLRRIDVSSATVADDPSVTADFEASESQQKTIVT